MEQLNKYIEHTLLKQDAAEKDLIKLFDEAKENNFLGVCVNPCYVKLAKENLFSITPIYSSDSSIDSSVSKDIANVSFLITISLNIVLQQSTISSIKG
jgi:hypothetical protein